MISGRGAADLEGLLGLRERPEIWGSHGLERLKRDRVYETCGVTSRVSQSLTVAREWIEREGLVTYLEIKPFSLAFHTRGVEDSLSAALSEKVSAMWSRIGSESGLQVHEFDGGIELRVQGIGKGRAVDTTMDESPDDLAAVYMGDDLTDEDAFEAIKGRGLAVLVREDLRPTAADLWIEPPNELLDLLDRWLNICRNDQ